MKNIIFDNPDRQYWIKSINSLLKIRINSDIVTIKLGSNISLLNFEAIHTVLLSCYFQYLKNNKHMIRLEVMDKDLESFFWESLKIDLYFKIEGIGHVESNTDLYHKLWRVEEKHSYAYAKSITDFLENSWLTNKDLSAVNNTFLEVYQNIYDHSEATIAFSDVTIDKNKGIIQFAACDLGLGIPTVLRSYDKKYKNDGAALKDSLEIGVTSKSKDHNRGFGLDNLVSILGDKGVLRIASNKALLFTKNDKNHLKLYNLDFSFTGTLIYMDIDVNCLPKIEGEIEDFRLCITQ